MQESTQEIFNNEQNQFIELDTEFIESYFESKHRQKELELDRVEKINNLLETAKFAIKGLIILSGFVIFFHYLPEIINLYR